MGRLKKDIDVKIKPVCHYLKLLQQHLLAYVLGESWKFSGSLAFPIKTLECEFMPLAMAR